MNSQISPEEKEAIAYYCAMVDCGINHYTFAREISDLGFKGNWERVAKRIDQYMMECSEGDEETYADMVGMAKEWKERMDTWSDDFYANTKANLLLERNL